MRTAKKRIGLVAAAFAAAVAFVSCGPAKPVATLSTSDSWCPEGFEVGPSDTCFAVPERTTKDTPVIVYLHGMYAGHGSAEEWNLVRSVITKGFAVVVPRGKRGLCAWKEELKDHFCWPQETEDPQAFKNVVADWDRVLWQVDAIMEGGPHKRYVLGYSNGGFFAEYLAAHAMFPAQAYAIVNGGPLGPQVKPPKPVPLLLVAADGDPDQGPKMKELHDGLAKVGWLHAFCTRPGQHPLAAQDVEASVHFFKRESEGSLKPSAVGYYACEGGTVAGPEAASAIAPPTSTPPPRPKK
jgi:poly(3-hydroxybutyrate) depolymerase